MLIKPVRFTDQARESTSGQRGATVSSPGTPTSEQTNAIDRTTGDVEQRSPQSQSGTGNAPNATGSTTGAAVAPVGGTVQPSNGTAQTGFANLLQLVPGQQPTTTNPTEAATPANPTAPEDGTVTDEPRRVVRPDGTTVTTARETSQKTEPGKITLLS